VKKIFLAHSHMWGIFEPPLRILAHSSSGPSRGGWGARAPP